MHTIIKSTDRHNKALLAKEQSESQARLRDLADAEEEKRKKYRPTAGEIRGRQLGNIAALLGGQSGSQKRKRPATTADDDGEGRSSEMLKARAAEDARRAADMEAVRKRQREKDGKRRRSLERYSVRRGKERRHENEEETSHRRNSSSEEDEIRAEKDRKRRRKERSRSPQSSSRKHRHRSPLRHSGSDKAMGGSSERSSRNLESSNRSTSRKAIDDGEDSDPLDDLIGPAPPPKTLPRGRGALKGSSGMDSRFSSEYDPKSDVQLDDDTRDDWDDALEALRDRAKFRQQGADRLREAGFTEEQVKKWEKGDEKTIDDVKWTRAGEKREWDRGKNLDEEDDL